MSIKKLNEKIHKQHAKYVEKVLKCFNLDPAASDYTKNYNDTESYLWELIEKDGSVLKGLISAMENYLEK